MDYGSSLEAPTRNDTADILFSAIRDAFAVCSSQRIREIPMSELLILKGTETYFIYLLHKLSQNEKH